MCLLVTSRLFEKCCIYRHDFVGIGLAILKKETGMMAALGGWLHYVERLMAGEIHLVRWRSDGNGCRIVGCHVRASCLDAFVCKYTIDETIWK